MTISDFFNSKAKQLFWRAVEPAQLSSVPMPAPVPAGRAYYTIRLCEMYLASARKLWHQMYPMLHCYAQLGATAIHTVVSPDQLADLGNENLDRLANLNVRLSGPTPYNGEEIGILCGLYAVPGYDASTALINLVSSFTGYNPVAITTSVGLSTLIRNGVESILGLDQTILHLGVRDGFNPVSKPLESGYYVSIAASTEKIDSSQLWVSGGRLLKGKDLGSGTPYEDHDYFLLAIEQSGSREDWQQFPELQDPLTQFTNLIGDGQFSADEKRKRFAALWPAFQQKLINSPNLTDPDRQRIATQVATGLLNQLKLQQDTNPFLQAA